VPYIVSTCKSRRRTYGESDLLEDLGVDGKIGGGGGNKTKLQEVGCECVNWMTQDR
jgi:hypothetical protein